MANTSSKFDSTKDYYISNFTNFESQLNGQSKTFLHDLRKDALEKLREMNFPTTKDEEWKYTNVSPILKHNFKLVSELQKGQLTADVIDKYLFSGFEYDLMVFVNGKFDKELSKIGELPDGVILDGLDNVMRNNADLVQNYINKYSKIDNAFNALNLSYATDGLFLYIPDGKILERPIQVLFINGGNEELTLSVPRNLVIAGKDAIGKVIVNFTGYGDKEYFTNTVTEIVTGENANLDYCKIQNEKQDSFHIDKTDIYQEKGSVFNHYSFSFGSSLSRTDLNSVLDDENIECHYYGLYLGTEKRHIDHHTFVDHAKSNCMSNEVYKGILDDNSRGVFSGKIMVRPDAQKTNAYQSNKTVLLSDKANIDTKPQLEIFADDVKCSHGATVGHLDDEAYFYIRSRGVEAKMAQSMLIHAFTADVIEAVNVEAMREQLSRMIFESLHRVKV